MRKIRLRDRYDFQTLDLFSQGAYVRQSRQELRILEVMKDHRWRTYAEIAKESGQKLSSVEVVVLRLRRPDRGGFAIEARERYWHMRTPDRTREFRLAPGASNPA